MWRLVLFEQISFCVYNKRFQKESLRHMVCQTSFYAFWRFVNTYGFFQTLSYNHDFDIASRYHDGKSVLPTFMDYDHDEVLHFALSFNKMMA